MRLISIDPTSVIIRLLITQVRLVPKTLDLKVQKEKPDPKESKELQEKKAQMEIKAMRETRAPPANKVPKVLKVKLVK